MLAALWLIASGAVVVAGTRGLLIPWLDAELAPIETWQPPTTVQVFDRDGEVVDAFSLVRRVWVPVEDVDPLLVDAIIAAEDRRFYDHHGVDGLGILRALIRNLQAGTVRQGGSTITQQVVKNVRVGAARSLLRKLHEAALALRLEQRMTKREILEIYLNLIYLGSGNYGVEAAAMDYLGTSARDLDLSGSALLAGLIPAPSRFSPRADLEAAQQRRARVLEAMVSLGTATATAAAAAARRPIAPPPRGLSEGDPGVGYYTAVRRVVHRLLGKRLPFEAGLSVYTPLDARVQRAATRAVREAAAAVEARQGIRLDLIPNEAAPPTRAERRTWALALTSSTATTAGSCGPVAWLGRGRVGLGGGSRAVPAEVLGLQVWNPDSDAKPTPFPQVMRRHDLFEGCVQATGEVAPRTKLYVEGAAVVLDWRTGQVRALVGGRDMALEGFNRATQALRQSGSAFKPFVFAAALDEGDTQLDTALDAPLALVAGKNRLWEPQNAGGYFLGRVALRWAFAHSLNTPAVRLAARYGTLGVIRRARAAGIRSPIRRDLTMALGTSELRPIELAVGIAGIVRGGVAVKPAWIDRLVDFDGEDVGRAGRRVALPGVGVQLPGGEGPRFMAPGPAWEVVDMMRAAIERGTGKAAFAKGEFRGGKTGTTSGNKDAWFVGFARGHVVAVWLGQDDGRTLGWGESGGRAALPAWRTIVEALPPGPDPERPPDVIALPFLDAHVDVTADHVPQFRMRHHIPREDEPLPAAPRKLRPRARRRAPQPDAVPEPVVEGESS